MANFLDIVTILRRYLRDPDAAIWDSEMLGLYWNQAQIDVAQKIQYIQRARSLRYPSQYSIVYFFEWEYQHIEGDILPVLNYAQTLQQLTGGAIITYPWETTYWASTVDYLTSVSGSVITSTMGQPIEAVGQTALVGAAVDEGYRIIHPWEAYYGTPSDTLKVKLHDKIESIRYAAFDEETITGISQRELAVKDPYYKITKGSPLNYYFPDHYHNELCLYPQPTITLDDGDTLPSSGLLDDTTPVYTDYAYLHDWEYSSSHAGTSVYQFGHEYSTTYIYLYDWEYEQLAGYETSSREINSYEYMRWWETEGVGGVPGLGDSYVDERDTGLATDSIGTTNQLFLVYDCLPDDVDDYADTIEDWPQYMLKTIIAATLERCYSADTDGFIPSLRDFWKMRKEIGIKAINIFRRMKSSDRTYRLGSNTNIGERKYPRLPWGNQINYT